jgi:hypothetical protein
MNHRAIIYTRSLSSTCGSEPEFLSDVRGRGDIVVAVHVDDGRLAGRGKNAAWNDLLGKLDQADYVVVGCAADLPGRRVGDLLAILAMFRKHGVTLRSHRKGIDTDAGSAAILDLVAACSSADQAPEDGGWIDTTCKVDEGHKWNSPRLDRRSQR